MDNHNDQDNTLSLSEAMTLIGIRCVDVERVTERDEPRWDSVRREYVLDGEDE